MSAPVRAKRFVVYGAGAIGGGIGAQLDRHGHDVVLIARGDHLDAMKSHGLRVRTPEGDFTVEPDVVSHPQDIDWRQGDLVLLCTKSQDTESALGALRDATELDVPVVCVQNGVANERMAARHFASVYATVVWMPATHLEPGVVLLQGSPLSGVLDTGCYPQGTDTLCESLCEALSSSHFLARPRADVMRFKYAKLQRNLGNALQALCGNVSAGDIVEELRAEAVACFAAAGVESASPQALREELSQHYQHKPIDGETRSGSSTWQSLTRGLPLETDYLNGEIVLLGRLYGVATPFNAALQTLARRHAAASSAPGSVAVDEVRELASKL